jgi:3-oxoacyl-[acyl-carrier-protein] synthase II
MQEVYIVKQTMATVLGDSLQATWQRLLAGHSGFGGGAYPAVDRFGGAQAARVSELLPADGENRVCALTRRVLEPLTPVPVDACVVWTGIKGNAEFIEAGQAADMPWLAEHYRQWAVAMLGTGGGGFEINAACASSTVGIAIAAQKIAQGQHGCAVVCGGDVVTDFVVSGFSVLKALTPSRCRPFDLARDGMCIGDGAVAMLLADARTARELGFERLAQVSGWGITNDANHITGPSADGAGLARAIVAALELAGVRPDEVQAFCAHGTGTVFNDGMELAAVETVFGARCLPVFSIKGAIGHTLGAAGGIDAAVCVHALAERRIPPTAGLEAPMPRAEGRVSRGEQAFNGQNILTSNSGFGGVNAALLLSAVPGPS